MAFVSLFTLAYAFTVFSHVYASTHLVRSFNHNLHRSFPHHLHRRQSVPTTLPGKWSSLGCYTDNTGDRTLSSATYTSTTAMTVESCIAFCTSSNYIYAGVEYSQECYCSNTIGGTGTAAPIAECNMPCTGNHTESCGAGYRLNVFWSGSAPPATPMIVPSVGPWVSLGCYSDSVAARTLPNAVGVAGQVTIESCTAACLNAGFSLAGAEYAGQCFCGNSFQNGGAPIPASDCNMACVGNSSEFCGGPNALNVYNHTTGSSSSGNPPPPTSGPIIAPGSGSWVSLGCYSDSVNARVLSHGMAVTGQVTIQTCTAACQAAGYQLSGAEYADECYCDNKFENGGAPISASSCNMVCAGNSSEYCGGPNAINVYNNTGAGGSPAPSGPITPFRVGSWVSQGCYNDSVVTRVLGHGMNVVGQVSIETCTTACFNAGYTLAGAEYADECYCDNKLENNGAPIPASGCNMACAGNSSEYCGGPDALNVYSYSPSGPSTPPTVGAWVSLGCYNDSVASRVLANNVNVNGQVSIETCTTACLNAGYSLAGAEYAGQCFCDNRFENFGAPIPASACNMACVGNSNEFCGGPNALNVYNYTGSSVTPPPPPTGPITPSSVGAWVSLGCYNDSVVARVLANGVNVVGQVSIETCTTACFNAGYPLAGAEYAGQCFCDTKFENYGAPIPASGCNMACTGNSSEFCGGPDALNVYNYTGTNLPPIGTPPPPPPPPGGGGVVPVTQGLPTPWKYAACYVDGANGRVLAYESPDNSALTVQSCIATCAGQNYTVAGLEYSVQCFCGNELIEGAATAPSTDCSMGCGGNATEACGGPNRLSVYSSTASITILPVPTPKKTNLPGSWQYKGCFQDFNGARVLPYQNVYTSNNTAEACLNQCAAFGYPAAGMEYGDECYCGDITDVTASGNSFVSESECNFPCPGNPTELCGGPLVMTLYYWNGAMTVWNTPSNIGYYEFLVPGVVVPLIATVGVNNKVTFLEKGGTGFPNSTGAYELDLSLVNNFDLAWRTMHIKTDVFCSGSIILPDLGARQINIGGWSLQSTFGVRIYTPDGSPGVNGTNDWEENVNELSLQVGRWYPSVVLLSNGSILVVGGETGSNASPQPNLEIMPKIPGGSTVVHLDFLARTDPNNLYPFLIVLPSGNIFIGYYNEARILDKNTFDTVTTLPNIPGAVDNFLAGRTYPMEGTAVLLPQSAPFTDPVVILVCGGSTPGAAVALDNCVSIAPEVANPTWTLERMPSKRVMTCMVGLPDGTFMIMNGAQQGVAGFGLATDPNLGAILYDPTKPVGQRFSILNTTIVARLYHSEATLLPDGRVLVSGSDPQTYYANGTEVFPEEFRIEVYVPPYLNQGFTQPTYTISITDWGYGKQYSINVKLFQGTTSTMRVSLVAATSSTHGNIMGGRTLFPSFTCAGNTCTITAPPNPNVSPPGWHQLFILDGPTPSHSQWVRIGGDPAKLGNWPNFPDFTLPGV